MKIIDGRFKLLDEFRLTVPPNYQHAAHLASFAEENRSKFNHYDVSINDANFVRATNKLIPGKTYMVKIYMVGVQDPPQFVITRVSSEDCLEFLKSVKAVFVGAQGLSLVWQVAKEKLRKSKKIISFDEKTALLKDRNGVTYSAPYIFGEKFGSWGFSLYLFGLDLSDRDCLLCFNEE